MENGINYHYHSWSPCRMPVTGLSGQLVRELTTTNAARQQAAATIANRLATLFDRLSFYRDPLYGVLCQASLAMLTLRTYICGWAPSCLGPRRLPLPPRPRAGPGDMFGLHLNLLLPMNGFRSQGDQHDQFWAINKLGRAICLEMQGSKLARL